MNLGNARSEASARFHDFTRDFQASQQVAAAALTHVQDLVREPDGAERLLGLLARARSSWKANLPDPSDTVASAIASTLRLSIVQIHSAVDSFVTDLEADYYRWADFASLKRISASINDEESEERLEKVCTRLGWSFDPISLFKPPLRFFRLLRNCIAHRSSIASDALADCVNDPVTISAVDKLRASGIVGDLPRIPAVIAQQPLHLELEDQFFCLATVGHAIRYIDAQFVKWLGEDGMVYLTAFHTLLDGTPSVATEAYRLPENVINHALTTRYSVVKLDQFEVAPILSRLGVWNVCRERHADHYKHGPRLNTQATDRTTS